MAVDLPTAFNPHQGDPDSDVLRVANVGTITATSSKANGGVSLNNTAQQWQANSVGNYGGIRWEFINGGTAVDFEANEEIFVIAVQQNAPNRVQLDTIANQGSTLRMYSSTNATNYREFTVAGQDSIYGKYRSSPTAFMVDPNNGGDLDSGTYDPSSVQNYSYQIRKANQAGTASSWMYVSEAWRIGTTKTATNIPRLHGSGVNMSDLPTTIEGTSQADILHVFCSTLSDNIYFVGCPFVIGNESGASTVTTFDDEGATFISPASKVANDPRFHLTTNSMRVYADLRNNAADTAILSGNYTWGTAAPWDFSQSDSAVITLSGNFNGMGDFTVGSSCSCSGVWTLASGSVVIIDDADMTGAIINGDAQLLTETDLTDITINGDLVINNGASNITLNFSNVTITGDITNTGTGTCTINASDGSTISSSESGTGAGEVNIINSVLVKIIVRDVSTNSVIENARVLLEADTGGDLAVGTDVINGVTDVNGEIMDSTFNFTNNQPVIGRVRKGTNTPRYKSAPIIGTISNNGFETTVFMISDE